MKCNSFWFNIKKVKKSKGRVFFLGVGGSAGNAIHIANDWIYGTGNCGNGEKVKGLKVNSLSSNPAVLTCLGNDLGYENLFSYQLEVQASKNDILLALSGSGNSPNIIKAIEVANSMRIQTIAIVGFDGGRCKKIANKFIHCRLNDMEIAEDAQIATFHFIKQKIYEKLSGNNEPMPKYIKRVGEDLIA